LHRDSGFAQLLKAVEERIAEDKKIIEQEQKNNSSQTTVTITNTNTVSGSGNTNSV